MTPSLPDEQRKQIERDASYHVKYGQPKTKTITESKYLSFIAGAEKYATLCQQKDEEIARLRSALGRIEQYSDPGSYATAIVEMKAIATEALKPIMP